MDGTGQLIWGMVFGAIGFGFFLYGKRQKAVVPFVTGIALFIFPYFVTNVYVLVLSGFALMAVPYFVRL